MKSNVFENRNYIECECGNPNHIMIFEAETWGIEEEDNPNYDSLVVYFSSNWKQIWYKRIIIGLKYIFNRKPFEVSDGVIISERNIKQLEDIIKVIRRKND